MIPGDYQELNKVKANIKEMQGNQIEALLSVVRSHKTGVNIKYHRPQDNTLSL